MIKRTSTMTVLLFLYIWSWLQYSAVGQTNGMPIPQHIGNADNQQSGVYDHTLHVVISAPEFVIDEFETGSQMITLDGSASHTHEPGAKLVKWQWTKGTIVLSDKEIFDWKVTAEFNTICLTIFDNNGDSLKDCQVVKLVQPCNLPGTEVSYYKYSTNINSISGNPLATEFFSNYQLLGETAYPAPFLAQFKGTINFKNPKKVQVSDTSLPYALYIDGQKRSNNVQILAGPHSIDFRIKVEAYEQLPVKLLNTEGDLFPNAWLVFDATGNGCGSTGGGGNVNLVINSIQPNKGSQKGGTLVTLNTNQLSPANVQVLVGNKQVQANVQTGKTTFKMPPGTGIVQVKLKKGNVTSAPKTFTYTSQDAKYADKVVAQGAFAVVEYCFGYLFTAEYGGDTVRGRIKQWKVNDNYTLQLVKTINLLNIKAPQGADSVLGLVCDPYGKSSNFDVYVHHAKLYQTSNFSKFPITGNPFVSYKGFISRIRSKENFGKLNIVVKNLPVSNRDHSVNGGVFLDDGTLLTAVGGMTNQGYPGLNMGGLPESPLSGAILATKPRTITKAKSVRYKWIPGQKPSYIPAAGKPKNAIYGDAVMLTKKTNFISTYATGFRNPFDCTVTQAGKVFCTDNGSNPNGYGDPQVGCITKNGKLDYKVGAEDPSQQKDEILQVFKGQHYGHPNMARVRAAGTCTAEGKYTPGDTSAPGVTAPTTTIQSSTDGIIEFISNVFDGDKRGQLYACKYKQALHELDASGKLQNTDYTFPCLDVTVGPGGALYATDLSNDDVLRVRFPVGALGAFDVFPYRGTQGVQFILSGDGFNKNAPTTVKFGSQAASQVKVQSPRRITGNLPGVKGQVDVVVKNGGKTYTIPKGYKGL